MPNALPKPLQELTPPVGNYGDIPMPLPVYGPPEPAWPEYGPPAPVQYGPPAPEYDSSWYEQNTNDPYAAGPLYGPSSDIMFGHDQGFGEYGPALLPPSVWQQPPLATRLPRNVNSIQDETERWPGAGGFRQGEYDVDPNALTNDPLAFLEPFNKAFEWAQDKTEVPYLSPAIRAAKPWLGDALNRGVPGLGGLGLVTRGEPYDVGGTAVDAALGEGSGLDIALSGIPLGGPARGAAAGVGRVGRRLPATLAETRVGRWLDGLSPTYRGPTTRGPQAGTIVDPGDPFRAAPEVEMPRFQLQAPGEVRQVEDGARALQAQPTYYVNGVQASVDEAQQALIRGARVEAGVDTTTGVLSFSGERVSEMSDEALRNSQTYLDEQVRFLPVHIEGFRRFAPENTQGVAQAEQRLRAMEADKATVDTELESRGGSQSALTFRNSRGEEVTPAEPATPSPVAEPTFEQEVRALAPDAWDDPAVAELLGLKPATTVQSNNLADLSRLERKLEVANSAEVMGNDGQLYTVSKDPGNGFVVLDRRGEPIRGAPRTVQEAFDLTQSRTNIIDEALRAEGNAVADVNALHERAAALQDEIDKLKSAKAADVDGLGGGDWDAEIARAEGEFDEIIFQIDNGRGLNPGWRDVNREIIDEQSAYLDMSLEDLEFAKKAKLQNIYDPNRANERGLLGGDVSNQVRINDLFLEKKELLKASPTDAADARIREIQKEIELLEDKAGQRGFSIKNSPTAAAAHELQLYNELRQIQAAIDLKLGKHTPLSEALDRIARFDPDSPNNIEYFHAGFNPFPALRSIIFRLGSRPTPSVTYRGLTPQTSQLGAMNVPDPVDIGTTAIDDAIRYKEEQVLDPGKITGSRFVRPIARLFTPNVGEPRAVRVANEAAGGIRMYVAADLDRALVPIAQDLMNAWRANPAQFDPAHPEGPTLVAAAEANLKRPLTDGEKLVIYMEWPELFLGGHPDLPLLQRAFAVQQMINVNSMREGYGSKVERYTSPHLNGIYVPHTRSTALKPDPIDEVLNDTHADLSSRPGIGKHRSYASILERYANRKDDVTWEQETDLRILADIHSRALAREAAVNTFQQGAGGLTHAQAVDVSYPGLRVQRDVQRRTLNSLVRRAQTLTQQTRFTNREAKANYYQQTELARRIGPLQANVAALGTTYGAGLSHLSGQLYELLIARNALTNRASVLATRSAMQAFDKTALGQSIDRAASDLRELVRNYQAANIKERGWRMAAGTERYWRDGETIKAVEKYAVAPANTPLTTILDAADELRAWQLGPDLSPLTLNGAMLGATSHPFVAVTNAGMLLQAFTGNVTDDVLFGPTNVDPHFADLFTFTSGQPLTGRTPLSAEARVEGRGAERLPKIGRGIRNFNERIDRTLLYGRFKAWEAMTRTLMARPFNRPENAAAAEAWAAMGKMMPQIPGLQTGRRAFPGFETSGSRIERAAQLSISYAAQPFNFTKDFTSGMARILATPGRHIPGVKRITPEAPTGRQYLAILQGLSVATILGSIAAASAVAFDDDPRKTTEEKILNALTPGNPDFWRVHLGDGKSIPIGGPFRRAYTGSANMARAAYYTATGEAGQRGNPTLKDALWSYIRGGLPNYATTTYDLGTNKDYFGRTIVDAKPGSQEWLAAIAAYALEQVNITAGVPFRALRTGEGGSPEDLALSLLAQGSGLNLTQESASARYNQDLETRALPALQQAGILPPTDVDGKPLSSFDQLGSGELDTAKRWLEANDPELHMAYLNFRRDRDYLFQEKDDRRTAVEAAYRPAIDRHYDDLLTGRMTPKEAWDKIASVRDEMRGRIKELYDDPRYQEVIATFKDNAMRKLEDDWFRIPESVTGYVPNARLNSTQWEQVEIAQAAFLADLDSRAPGLAARFQRNLDLRDSVVDSHPAIKLKREVDTLSEDYYNLPDTGPQRAAMLKANPALNVTRWVAYGGELHSIEAADAVLAKQGAAPVAGTVLSGIDFNARPVKFHDLSRPLNKDEPMWNQWKHDIITYQSLPSDIRQGLDLRNYDKLNATLIYFGQGNMERLYTQGASQYFDAIMTRLNWNLWQTTNVKPQVMDYMTLTEKAKDFYRAQYPQVDVSWNLFQKYLFDRNVTFRSEEARNRYGVVMGLKPEEVAKLPLDTSAPIPLERN